MNKLILLTILLTNTAYGLDGDCGNRHIKRQLNQAAESKIEQAFHAEIYPFLKGVYALDGIFLQPVDVTILAHLGKNPLTRKKGFRLSVFVTVDSSTRLFTVVALSGEKSKRRIKAESFIERTAETFNQLGDLTAFDCSEDYRLRYDGPVSLYLRNPHTKRNLIELKTLALTDSVTLSYQ